jgi:hypothetical protein
MLTHIYKSYIRPKKPDLWPRVLGLEGQNSKFSYMSMKKSLQAISFMHRIDEVAPRSTGYYLVADTLLLV